ncbi:hypothetical protein LOD99_2837 [Oopsacas minuta]|uniref:GDT1 family protein n=1 Tax=Oopsacas minuta TaxID=111878 RepID=A0AAV7K122_9METZ|nr:hypothetical protein LOD99_2837 [Oopsacas minuta]
MDPLADLQDHIPNQSIYHSADFITRFVHAFAVSFLFIVVSELGDKTFFIAAILAMRRPRMIVFLGSIFALGLMHTFSVLVGMSAKLIPRYLTQTIASVLLLVFGGKMVYDGCRMKEGCEQEEFEEVKQEVSKGETGEDEAENGGNRITNGRIFLRRWISPVFLQAFTLTFLAEWGDRSQLTTIVLAAREEPFGITMGGILGHSICTGLAVLGGKFLSEKISTRTVTIIGGIVFIGFALYSFIYRNS